MKPLLILLLTLPIANLSGQEVSDTVDYFADNGLSNTVKTMQHPAGEHHDGITYVCYQGPLEDPYVAAYDHDKKEWSGPYKAGESLLGKDPSAKIDNHGKPAMIIDDAGYIHLVFGGHGGLPEQGVNPLGNHHDGAMKHVVSKRPLDITEWEELNNIPTFGTYNQFVKLDNGDIYLFYRHGAHRSDWVYQLSTDNGRTFAPPVSVLNSKRTKGTEQHPVIYDTWYAWFDNGEGNDIIATFNYHVCKGPDHDGERHDSYYMVFDTEEGRWHSVTGKEVAAPVTKDMADRDLLVEDSGDLWTVRGAVRLDADGNPHLIFYRGEQMGLKHGGPKEVVYYRWTGTAWIEDQSDGLPVATGDLVVSDPLRAELLLAGNTAEGAELAWWRTRDGGKSFAKEKVLYALGERGVVTTAIIRNAHPDARVVIGGKGQGEFRRMYLVGDGGAVRRSAAAD
ncbi:hypothetical protein GGR28_003666 [Lewinella aquimaris]|uniref:Uncharacterized protein n=1 Tax=Neolewinella aquimaris TaxID=1835722 RepID=A0A840EBZ0_9BACT|nr:BNR-4 repeat-containing protein [Neolewinella aquimaris]MBB4081025.1 hypothetical protein [Neolewinella aquimaris]